MKRFFMTTATLAVLSALLFSTGCGAASDMAAPESAAAYDYAAEPAENYAAGEVDDYGYYEEPAAADYYDGEYAEAEFEGEYTEGSGMAEIVMLAPDNDEGIELSYSVNLQLQTSEFMAGIRTLNTAVAQAQGYTTHASVQGRGLLETQRARTANYAFQIPSANLSSFLMEMEDNYNLLYLEQDALDLTVQHEQTDNRIEQLREQEQRLQESLDATEDPEARLDIEMELQQTQRELNSQQARSDDMTRQVRYSSVNVTLHEFILPEEIPELTWDDRLDGVKTETGIRFLRMVQNLLIFLIAATPVLSVLLVLGLIAFGAHRLYLRHTRKKTAAKDMSDIK